MAREPVLTPLSADHPVLKLTRELLRLEIQRLRRAGTPSDTDPYRGLYISDEDVDRAIADADDQGRESGAARDTHEVRMALRREVDADRGTLFRLSRLTGLSSFESSCLVLCLVSEVDLGMERVVAFAQDDVTKRRPRVDLAARLLADPSDPVPAARSFHGDSPLLLHGLIGLHEDSAQPFTPLAAKSLSLDPRATAFLLGERAIDERIIESATLTERPPGELRANLEPPTVERFLPLASLPATELPETLVSLAGVDDQLNADIAGMFASRAGLALLEVDAATALRSLDAADVIRIADREAALSDAVLHIRGVSELQEDSRAALLKEARTMHRLAPLTLLSGEGISVGLTVELEHPGFVYQRELWQSELDAIAGQTLDPAVIAALAGRFTLPTAAVRRAVTGALSLARSRDPGRPTITLDDLFAAAREQSAPILNDLAQKATPHYSWDDIILPVDAADQLQEICNQVKLRHRVYDQWGFDKKLSMGKGLVALFAGESGTGKTMAADVLAGALGIDLYKIDLSTIVSKYIGETEKNLKSIFSEASRSNAILFFDEADALFGKRSEVRDAHDRYANIETAYLLQQIEQYTGVVILATNLKMNLDEAFMRRMHFVIDFPMPDEDDRRRIWEATMPPEMPKADDLDIPFLAARFRISGGNIRNIILAAAFLAAAEDSSVSMRHMVSATKREFQKLGRIINEVELGPYARYLERHPRASV